MATDITTIYRFLNATLIKWNGGYSRDSISLLEDGTIVREKHDLLSEEAVKSLGLYSYRLHKATTEELELVSVTSSQEVVSFVPSDASTGLRELTEADYEKLTPGFQKLYKKKLSEPREIRTVIEHELKVIPFELQEEFLYGKAFATKLHSIVQPIRERERRSNSYSYGRDTVTADIRNNLPLELSSEELLKVIELTGQTILRGNGYAATVDFNSGYRTPSELKIKFFEAPYDGTLTKVFATKKGGGHYADGRGHMVRKFPKVVGNAVVTAADVSGWWTSIGGTKLSEDEKLEALEKFARHLWRV